MIHEGKDLAGESRTERADLVVVGTGPGGAVLAARCAEAGMRVVMLEQGPFLRARDFNQREDEMTNRLVGRRGFHFSEDDGNLGLLYCETVGGTTVHFWADTPRVPDSRLNEWADRFGLEGFRPDAFAAHYAHAEEGMHVERAHDYQVNDNNRKVLAGARALGWACERVPQARKNCVACGYCQEGCSYNRKQSMLVSYVPRATRAGAVLYADARAETILTSADRRRALGVEARLLEAQTRRPHGTLRVEAPRVVVACGGIGSPALLLRKKLANGSGWVGRNLFVNPAFVTYALFDEPFTNYRGIPCSYAVTEFIAKRTDAGRYVEGGHLMLTGHLYPSLTAAVLSGFGEAHRRQMEAYPRLGSQTSVLDDEEPGEVRLGADGRARVHYRLRGVDVLKTRDFFKKSAAIFFAAGAREFWVPNNERTVLRGPEEIARIDKLSFAPNTILYGGPHLLGTCRMGADPRESVVDAHCESHEVRGLHVVDGSSFPTSMSVDPSLTIAALSDQVAEHLIAAERG